MSPSSGKGSPRRVLIRCQTPTDWLCPCGAVARRLRKLGLDHEVRRVPYRRSSRPEVEELTGQRRVPVLIDGDEVISDSRRILQWLDHSYGAGVHAAGSSRPAESSASRPVPPGGGDEGSGDGEDDR